MKKSEWKEELWLLTFGTLGNIFCITSMSTILTMLTVWEHILRLIAQMVFLIINLGSVLEIGKKIRSTQMVGLEWSLHISVLGMLYLHFIPI
jgi:hypothetical protein